MKDENEDRPWTMPLPQFGKRYYSLGRSASYAAAARGDIPVIRVGGKLLGLPRVAEAQLGQIEQTSRADNLPQAAARHMLDQAGLASAAARTRRGGGTA
jgi:hypothetical protein